MEKEIKQEEVLSEQEIIQEEASEASLEEEVIEDEEIISSEDLEPQSLEEILEDEEELSEEELQAEKEAEEKTIEEARQAALAREEDLKARYASLKDHRLAAAQLGIPNPDLHFNSHILAAKNHELAEEKMKELEAMDDKCYKKMLEDKWLEGRKAEYAKIDVLLMEALAEQAAGDESKMKMYLAKRGEIKGKYPKPE